MRVRPASSLELREYSAGLQVMMDLIWVIAISLFLIFAFLYMIGFLGYLGW
jgi:hypothetical protein